MSYSGIQSGYRFLWKIFSILLIATLLAGCAATGKPPPAVVDPLTDCRALYKRADAATERAGVRDHGLALVDGFPYLRVTRLLASFREELNNERQWATWTGHLAALDAEARALELRNLAVPVTGYSSNTLREKLDHCRELLLAADAVEPERRGALRKAAHVPDDYVTWWRVAGLYPFTAPIVAANIVAWHSETRAVYATPLAELPVVGELVRWAPVSASSTPDATLDAAQVSKILHNSLDSLGIPLPAGADLDRLFDTFAPVWEVDVADDDDRIGMLYWDAGPAVDVAHPTLYRKVSHTRFGDRILLQLNYIAWFPARSGNDIYAGRLDGINWRVTLGPDGEPWLYDAIHNCGCYHEFFPGRRLRLRSNLPSGYFEHPLVPQAAPEHHHPMVLRIAHRTHFIQRVYHDESPFPAQQMAWKDYNALRSLPVGEGYLSVFGAHGLIAGTERAERLILWPMGIRSPGTMRQWGRHATAFVGRRHFDDAFLIQSLFEEVP